MLLRNDEKISFSKRTKAGFSNEVICNRKNFFFWFP